jgi:hypothetical protein
MKANHETLHMPRSFEIVQMVELLPCIMALGHTSMDAEPDICVGSNLGFPYLKLN